MLSLLAEEEVVVVLVVAVGGVGVAALAAAAAATAAVDVEASWAFKLINGSYYRQGSELETKRIYGNTEGRCPAEMLCELSMAESVPPTSKVTTNLGVGVPNML